MDSEPLLSPAEIERRVYTANATLVRFFTLSGIAPTTFSRWRAGSLSPSLRTYGRMRDALRALEQEAKAA